LGSSVGSWASLLGAEPLTNGEEEEGADEEKEAEHQVMAVVVIAPLCSTVLPRLPAPSSTRVGFSIGLPCFRRRSPVVRWKKAVGRKYPILPIKCPQVT